MPAIPGSSRRCLTCLRPWAPLRSCTYNGTQHVRPAHRHRSTGFGEGLPRLRPPGAPPLGGGGRASPARRAPGPRRRQFRGAEGPGLRPHRRERRRQEHPAEDALRDHGQSSGKLAVRGKVASILELGSAFHPELSGRQNIVLNAALLGLSEREIRAKTPQIIAFSELDGFIDQPVKTYSTGMAMRLGFAIATQVEPDVLIIDEALSVGDGYFQKKCIDRLLEFTSRRRHAALLLARHVLHLRLLPAGDLAANGRVAACGTSQEVVRRSTRGTCSPRGKRGPSGTRAWATPRPARMQRVALPADEGAGRRDPPVLPGERWRLEVEWTADDPALEFHLAIGLNRMDGVEICSFSHAPGRGAGRSPGQPPLPGLAGAAGAADRQGASSPIYVFLLEERRPAHPRPPGPRRPLRRGEPGLRVRHGARSATSLVDGGRGGVRGAHRAAPPGRSRVGPGLTPARPLRIMLPRHRPSSPSRRLCGPSIR